MTTRLSLYNGALRHLGERRLSSLTESREPRRVLDNIWDNAFVNRVLQQGQWKHARRTLKIDYSTTITPSFGYRYAFAKPADCVRLMELCSDEFMQVPLLRYRDSPSYWLADLTEIYVGFVSDEDSFGGDLSKWPPNFTAYAELEMAVLACPRLENSASDLATLKADRSKMLNDALSTDAQTEPTRFPPIGNWAASRLSRSSSRRYNRA